MKSRKYRWSLGWVPRKLSGSSCTKLTALGPKELAWVSYKPTSSLDFLPGQPGFFQEFQMNDGSSQLTLLLAEQSPPQIISGVLGRGQGETAVES